MTNVQKINDLIGKVEKIIDKLEDAESNLDSFNDDLHSCLKKAKSSDKWLKGEIKSGLTWVEDWQENASKFKESFKQFDSYLKGILDNLVDWTSSDLISELNKILKRYRYVKRWVVLIAEYEKIKRKEIDTETSDSVKKLDALCDEADQIYDDFYDDSDDFWDKDEQEEESEEEEVDEQQEQEANETSQKEFQRYQSEIKQISNRTAQLRQELSKHTDWLVNSNNNMVKWYNEQAHTFNQWLYNECDTIFGWLKSFMDDANQFMDLFNSIEKYARDWLGYPDDNDWQWVISMIQSANKRYDYIEKWMVYTEKYTIAAFNELRDRVDAHVSTMNSYSSSVDEIMNLYYDNSDGFWKK